MNGPFLRALMVHLLTATGAVFAMCALVAAVNEDWRVMFLWLLIAFIVDGIDGPLARKLDVRSHAPQIDGGTLDLIIDYLTYVFIPVYALFNAGLLPDVLGWVVLVGLTFSSGLYFAGNWMKTEDNSFLGFPGCWNMVVLVLFALSPSPAVALAIVVPLMAAMFLPLKFVHPVRTVRWRPLSLLVTALWVSCALYAVLRDFETGRVANWMLLSSSLYLVFVGMAQQFLGARRHGARSETT
jgi:phosphatidylcholine synthase